MPEFVYPTAAELREVAPRMRAELEKNDPIFSLFPAEEVDASTILWEQRDDFIGLQNIRAVNGAFGRVSRVGGKRFRVEAMRFGDFIDIDERTLEEKRQLGSFGQAIDLEKEVLEITEQLLTREMNRDAKLLWTLASSGTFSVMDESGAVLGTDTYDVQTQTISTAWSTHASATPLKNFRDGKLKHRGQGVSFGRGAKAFMNAATYNDMILNTNASDLHGKRLANGATFNSIASINQVFLDDDLPEIIIHDEGYRTGQGVNEFTPHIPYKTVVVFGKRMNGDPVGKLNMTRNAQNPGMAPGRYLNVVDTIEAGLPAPRRIYVENGKNWAPTIEYPGSILIMAWT